MCLLLGMNSGETNCGCSFTLRTAPFYHYVYSGETDWVFDIGSSAETIALLTVGGVLLVVACVNEWFTKRSPIIPPRVFRVRPFLFHSSFFFPLYKRMDGDTDL